MSAFDIRTISDQEAADRLGFPLRSVRRVIDRDGLCYRSGRRRRLNEAHFLAPTLSKPRLPDGRPLDPAH